MLLLHALRYDSGITDSGGIISDSYWGKFKTILILSIVYCTGSIVLAVSSFPALSGNPHNPWGAILGLALLALGTGGIKVFFLLIASVAVCRQFRR
jgi:dipeptide/tripeptide permease